MLSEEAGLPYVALKRTIWFSDEAPSMTCPVCKKRNGVDRVKLSRHNLHPACSGWLLSLIERRRGRDDVVSLRSVMTLDARHSTVGIVNGYHPEVAGRRRLD
jgi:hypothetical protein